MLKSISKLVIFSAVILIIGGGLLILTNRQPPEINIDKSAKQGQVKSFQTIYSFDKDDDADGLSNAKEIIYGTDLKNPDTDQDGFLDGQEVKNGFDPTQPGRIKLSQRGTKNLTIEYFSWVKAQQGFSDPRLDQNLIQTFFEANNLLSFETSKISKDQLQITQNSPENLRAYLVALSRIQLPQEQISYQAMASQILTGQSTPKLGGVIQALEQLQSQLQELPVPASALSIHQEYLGIVQELKTMFAQLTQAQTDPVLLSLNQRKGQWLAQKAQDLLEKQQKLANSI